MNAAEIEADLETTLQDMGGLTRKDFLDKVLKARGVTLYEWKEDVVRPKLLLTKLARDRVKVEEKDIQDMFEARYGEKIDAQIIIFPPNSGRIPASVFDKIRKDPAEFDRVAAQQADPSLARKGGHIEPLYHHMGLPEIERAAFALQPGDVSAEIETPQGTVIIKCLAHIPPAKDKTIEKEHEALRKDVAEKKLQQLIPKVFEELRAEANPKSLMEPSLKSETDLKKAAQQELDEMKKNNGKTAPPAGH